MVTEKYGFSVPDEVYQKFDVENFRELRGKNKTAILKEFSFERIKTNFVDPTLFNNEEVTIMGSLDGFLIHRFYLLILTLKFLQMVLIFCLIQFLNCLNCIKIFKSLFV